MITRHHLLLLCVIFSANLSLKAKTQSSGPKVAAKVTAGTSKGKVSLIESKSTAKSDASKSKSSEQPVTNGCGSDCACWRN